MYDAKRELHLFAKYKFYLLYLLVHLHVPHTRETDGYFWHGNYRNGQIRSSTNELSQISDFTITVIKKKETYKQKSVPKIIMSEVNSIERKKCDKFHAASQRIKSIFLLSEVYFFSIRLFAGQ